MMRRFASATTLLLAACGAESRPYPVMSLFSEGAGERVVAPARYDTLWAYGGMADTLLAVPGPLVPARDGGVYVLDLQFARVSKFSDDGAVAWSRGRSGGGPGEFGNVRAMTAWRSGGVLLADSGNRRLLYFSPDGLLAKEVTVHDDSFALISGVVELADGTVVLDTDGSTPWLLVSPGTGETTPVPAPWEGLDRMHYLQRSGGIGGSGATWAFGFVAGNGFFVMEHDVVVGTYPYVEHAEFPEVSVSSPERGTTMVGLLSRPKYSGYRLSVRADTMFVLPGGTTPARLRVLDKYSLSTGRYAASQMLPGTASDFAVAGDDKMYLVTMDQSGLFPMLLSVRLSSVAAPTTRGAASSAARTALRACWTR